jgi:putative membrane protein
MKTMLMATAFAAAAALAACGPNASEQAATPPSEQTADALTPVVAPVDPAAKTLEFATKAANGDMIEIETSKIAVKMTKNAEVKKFAQMMVTDHTKTSAELKDWAGKTTVALPAALDGLNMATVDNIKNADAAGFDDKYLDTIIDAHEDAVEAFTDYAENGQEANLKAWATATLPKLTTHMNDAKALRDKINAAGKKTG